MSHHRHLPNLCYFDSLTHIFPELQQIQEQSMVDLQHARDEFHKRISGCEHLFP